MTGGGLKKGGQTFSRKKRGGQTFFTRLLGGGQIFFACVDAGRPSSARNGECYLKVFNKYSDAI